MQDQAGAILYGQRWGPPLLPQPMRQAYAEPGSCLCLPTLRLVSSMGLDRSLTSTCLFSAKEVADLTNPSISAPLKFFVRSAAQRSSCHVSGTGDCCAEAAACRGMATASSRRAADICICRYPQGQKSCTA